MAIKDSLKLRKTEIKDDSNVKDESRSIPEENNEKQDETEKKVATKSVSIIDPSTTTSATPTPSSEDKSKTHTEIILKPPRNAVPKVKTEAPEVPKRDSVKIIVDAPVSEPSMRSRLTGQKRTGWI